MCSLHSTVQRRGMRLMCTCALAHSKKGRSRASRRADFLRITKSPARAQICSPQRHRVAPPALKTRRARDWTSKSEGEKRKGARKFSCEEPIFYHTCERPCCKFAPIAVRLRSYATRVTSPGSVWSSRGTGEKSTCHSAAVSERPRRRPHLPSLLALRRRPRRRRLNLVSCSS